MLKVNSTIKSLKRMLFFFVPLLISFGFILFGKINPTPIKGNQDLLILPHAQTSRLVSLGHHQAMASLMWMKSIMYYGDHIVKGDNATWMMHMMNVVTSLDSLFYPSYMLVGSILQSEDSLDLIILDRGINSSTVDWNLRLHTAIRYIDKTKDYAKAAEILKPIKTDTNSKIPEYVRGFAHSIELHSLPIEITLRQHIRDYLIQGKIFKKKNEAAIARRLFYPKNPIWSKPTEAEISVIASILEDLDSKKISPQLCYQSLLALSKNQ